MSTRARRVQTRVRPVVLAVIPVSGQDREFRQGLPKLGGRSLLDFTFDAARESRHLTRVAVSTDDRRIARAARLAGFDVPFLRPAADRRQSLAVVIDETVRHLERSEPDFRPDWVVRLQVTFPFRDRGMIDRAIRTVLAQDVDSAFVAFPEFDTYWNLDRDGRPERLTTDVRVPRAERQPIYRELSGLFSMVRRDILARGTLKGDRLGILPVTSVLATIDLHGMHGDELAELVAATRVTRRLVR
jgi:CMP-N,N'-diacetyllegionaminic acid synthase